MYKNTLEELFFLFLHYCNFSHTSSSHSIYNKTIILPTCSSFQQSIEITVTAIWKTHINMPQYLEPLRRHEPPPGEVSKVMEKWDDRFPADDPVELWVSENPKAVLLGKFGDESLTGTALMVQITKGAEGFHVTMTKEVKDFVMKIAKDHLDPSNCFKYIDKKIVHQSAEGDDPKVLFRFVRCEYNKSSGA